MKTKVRSKIANIEKLLFIDSLFTIDKKNALIPLIILEKGFVLNYFLQKVYESDVIVEWFRILYENDFFVSNKYSNYAPTRLILKIGEQNEKKKNKETWELLKKVIEPVVKSRINGEKENHDVDYALYLTIERLPVEYYSENLIEFVCSVFESNLVAEDVGRKFLLKLINEKQTHFVEMLFSKAIEETNDKGEKFTSVMDSYWLKEFLDKNKDQLLKLMPDKIAKIIYNKIESIINRDKGQFNNIWIPSLENKKLFVLHDYSYQVNIVYYFRDIISGLDLEKKEKWINKLLKTYGTRSVAPIFIRLAFYFIDNNYSKFKKYFWNLSENPLETSLWKLEVYNLLKNNAENFTKSEVEEILSWIEKKKYHYSDKATDEQKQKSTAYAKREWLSALSNIEKKIPKIKIKREKNEKIYNAELDHPGYTFWVGTPSNAEIEEKVDDSLVGNIISMDIKDLKARLKKNSNDDNFDKYFWQAFKKDSEHFISNLDKLHDMKLGYAHSIITIIIEKFDKGAALDLNRIFSWIIKILDRVQKDKEYPSAAALVFTISLWIENATKGEGMTFGDEVLPSVKEVCLKLFDLPIYENTTEYNSFTIWNQSETRKWLASISFLLRWVKVHNTSLNNGERWKGVKEFQDKFKEKLLGKSPRSEQFYFVFSMYLPAFIYIDYNFVYSNLHKIFPKDKTFFKASFLGYISARNFYKDTFNKLKPQYKRAIKEIFSDKIDSLFSEKIIYHLSEMLREGDELIFELIASAHYSALKNIINYYNRQEGYFDRIADLWQEIDKRIENEGITIKGEVLQYIFRWTKYVIENNKMQRIIISEMAVLPDNFHGSSFILKEVERYAKTNPEFAAKILLVVSQKKYYFDNEIAYSILSSIYEKGKEKDKKTADKICDKLVSEGYFKAKDIYVNSGRRTL